MTAPCHNCPDRAPGCHSVCEKYRAYRAEMDAAHEKRVREAAVNDAGAARGDKIRRDAHRHGLSGRKNR